MAGIDIRSAQASVVTMKQIPPPLVVPKPCHAEWSAMDGDERKRFCGECGKHVYNLSAMTQGEAQKFADETQGRECVAYVRTDDGLMQSPNFFERIILRIVGWRPGFATVLLAILPAALASCVSRTTAGVPMPPGKDAVPTERKHQGNTRTGVTLGEPANVPVPGSPAPRVVPGKVAMPKK